MAPKSSSSSSKRKSSATSNSADPKVAKFKLPVEFVTRPHPPKDHGKETCTAYIHPNVLSSLEINPGSFCTVGKVGENGVLVIARAGDEEVHPVNVITLSKTIRSVGNLILGDRLNLKRAQIQPPYATKVTIGSLQGCDILECIDEKVVQKLLNDSGILMPGMIFQNLRTNAGDESIDIIITDVSDDSLPDVGQLDLNLDEVYGGLDNQFYLSPPFIFRKGSTHITFSKQTQANRKYNLPEPISYAAVGGLGKEIESLKSAIEIPLHQPTLFSSFGVSPPRGILLHGPPGLSLIHIYIPEGMKRGIKPMDALAENEEQNGQLKELKQLNEIDNELDIRMETNEAKVKAEENSAKSLSEEIIEEATEETTASNADDAEIDELLPIGIDFSRTKPASKNVPVKKEWAHVVDLNHKIENFDELIPNPARSWPFELDTFQKEAVYHLEQGDSVFVAAHTSACLLYTSRCV